MKTHLLSYTHHDTPLEAFVAYPLKKIKLHPLIILCHAWNGRNDFICNKALELANLGFIAFALDMYGKGIIGKSKEENAALKQPFIANREFLQKRVMAGYEVALNLAGIDQKKIGVVGFGFGGLCALDLACSGVDLQSLVSIYGHYDLAPPHLIQPIKSKILILHGAKDPIVPISEVEQFQRYLTEHNVDWQTHLFGSAAHAFTTPGSNDGKVGIIYDEKSAVRAWKLTCRFLEQLY